MKEFYDRCVDIYDEYRAVVPSYAPAALAFYLLLILIPACSLIAVGASFLNIDMSVIEDLIRQYIVGDYSTMVINILESRSINTVALVTMVFSFYAVSRSVGNIYEISKNMYGEPHHENFIRYYLYTFEVTFLLLLLFIGVIAILAIGPLTILFDMLYSLFGIRHVLLYFLLVISLMIIYMIVPRKRIHIEDAFQGALAASTLMLVLYYGLGIYFRFAHFESVYGPLSAIVIVLFVFNWVAEVFYIGMYISYILHRRRREDEKRKS